MAVAAIAFNLDFASFQEVDFLILSRGKGNHLYWLQKQIPGLG
jgi:hypothetical protein